MADSNPDSVEPADAPSEGGRACSSPVLDYLRQLHRECAALSEGTVATYIPELAKADPNWFGICLATTNGAVYEVGDTRQPFTIQSISKPFVYGMALEDHGRPFTLTKVGLEPTGDAFNSISLDPVTGRPRNPMINAGAIATAGLITGSTPQARFKRILDTLGLYAGRDLGFDEDVYRSESQTGHRNRAIGHMLRNFEILADDPVPVVELYFKQCSVAVTCRDLGLMAATLANQGMNPETGKQALRGEYVESVLSVMGSCGMYDYAGEWIYKIGMPAKSGVAGGIIAVLPGQLGVGVFSPPLDARGNSVRGIRVCDELSRTFDLHLFNRPGAGRSAVRLKFTGADMSSSRVRSPRESDALRQFGTRIKVYQLQGNLSFASTEPVVRDIVENAAGLDHVVLDFKRVFSLTEPACRMFYQVLVRLAEQRKAVLFTHADRLLLLRRFMKAKLGERQEKLFRTFDDNDPALEWCENEILKIALPDRTLIRSARHDDFELFRGLTAEELQAITVLLERRSYQRGEVVIRAGDEARELYFLARGNVSVMITTASGAPKRLATFSAGMAFGELALIDRAPRSATIVADTDTQCDLLSQEAFDRLAKTHPAIKIKLLENLCLSLCQKLRKANRQLSVFD